MKLFALALVAASLALAPRARAAKIELFPHALALESPTPESLWHGLDLLVNGDGHEGRHVWLVEMLGSYAGKLVTDIAVDASVASALVGAPEAVVAMAWLLAHTAAGVSLEIGLVVGAVVFGYFILPPFLSTLTLTLASRFEGRRLGFWKIAAVSFGTRLVWGLAAIFGPAAIAGDIYLAGMLVGPAVDVILVRTWDPPTGGGGGDEGSPAPSIVPERPVTPRNERATFTMPVLATSF